MRTLRIRRAETFQGPPLPAKLALIVQGGPTPSPEPDTLINELHVLGAHGIRQAYDTKRAVVCRPFLRVAQHVPRMVQPAHSLL